MALIPYRSNRNDSLSRVFDDFFRMPDLWEDTSTSIRGVSADVYEAPDAVVVEMATPGISPQDINIHVTGDTLSISGESKQEEKTEKRDYYQKQIRYGSFAQSISLPARVKSEEAEADFHNGILKVALPKSEEAKPKKIQVTIRDKGK